MGYRGSLQEPEGGPGDPPDLPSRRKPNRSPYLHRLPRLCPAGHPDAPAPRARAGTDRAQRAGKVRSRPDDRRPSAYHRRARDRADPLHPTRARAATADQPTQGHSALAAAGIGEEGDEDMGFDSAFVVMEDRADRQVPFQVLEGFLHGDELNVVLP